MMKVVLAGVSTRAAAESAARAGYDVTAFDAFGDLDQHPSVHVVSLPRDVGARFSAYRAARESHTVAADAVVYLSNFENHPRAVQTLAAGRALWGNGPDVLRRVRDPRVLSERLRQHGLPAPSVVGAGKDGPLEGEWLLKRLDSGGGRGVRYWRTGRRRSEGRRDIPRTAYLQEFLDGTPASLVFAAARGRMVPLGFSVQLIGRHEYGASGFRYCGNVLVGAADAQCPPVLFEQACAAARVVADEFDLIGVNGIDFVLRGSAAYAIEVNPRWSSSMELVERAYGVSVFQLHAAACADGALPAFDLQGARQSGRVCGKAIVFARTTCVMGDTQQWLDDPTLRDVPHPGERIDAGQPICTVLADAEDALACEAALVARARRVYADVTVSADVRVFSA